MEELTPDRILDACTAILNNLASDLNGLLPVVNPLYLNDIQTRFLAHLQQAIKENCTNTNTKQEATATEHQATQAYKGAISDWDRITKCDESYASIAEILDLAEELTTALGLDPTSVRELTNTRTWLERRVSMARGNLENMKRDMRFHVFDRVHFYLEGHRDANLGCEVPFPRGYEAPPKITAVGIKVTAGN